MIYEHQPPVNSEYIDSFPFDKTKIKTSGKNKKLSLSLIVEGDD